MGQRSYSQTSGIKLAVTKGQQENNSGRKFGFESSDAPNELDPFIEHEISPGSTIQIIPNFLIKELGSIMNKYRGLILRTFWVVSRGGKGNHPTKKQIPRDFFFIKSGIEISKNLRNPGYGPYHMGFWVQENSHPKATSYSEEVEKRKRFIYL